MNGKLYLCATPIGNLGDMSERLIETLKSADLIAAEDTRRTVKLLNHIGISKPLISYYRHNEQGKGDVLIKELQSGKSVALVSDAGTPGISDPGEVVTKKCIEQGIEVVPVPGPAALICALIISGMDTSRFVFEGFLPVTGKERNERISDLKNDKRTVILYEAPHKLLKTLTDLETTLGNRKVAVCHELTKIHESTLRVSLKEAVTYYTENQPKGEYVIVLEGKEQEKPDFSDITVKEHFQRYIEQGKTEKEAIKSVAEDRGVPKREIYNVIKIG